MTIRTLTSFALATALTLGVASLATAQSPHGANPHGVGPGADAHGMGALKKAGATDEQIAQYKDLIYNAHMKAIDLQAAVKKAELTQHKLHADGADDEAAMLAAVDGVFAARAALAKHMVSSSFGVRKALGEKLFKVVHPQMAAHAKLLGGMGGMGHGGAMKPGGKNPHGGGYGNPHHPQGKKSACAGCAKQGARCKECAAKKDSKGACTDCARQGAMCEGCAAKKGD